METPSTSRTDAAASARTLASQAQELLRKDILSGQLAPGQRLRTKDLQARYGLGLSPLRESLQRLSAEGMVVNDAQRGFAVAPVSVAELEDLTLARTSLESVMLPMAITKGSADWEAEILAAFHRLSRTSLHSIRRRWPMPACGSRATARSTMPWWPDAGRPGCCACTRNWLSSPSVTERFVSCTTRSRVPKCAT